VSREHESLEEGLARADKARQRRREQENEGARRADDCFCPSCGARGFQFNCPACDRGLYGGGGV